MKARFRVCLFLTAFLTLGSLGSSSLQGSILQHERLRLRNTFKTPEEVIAYYCARDASGFVWSGLLEAERVAFTLWREAPQQDSFFVARNYKIGPSQKVGQDANHVSIEVKYELAGIADGHGTRMPPPQNEYHVVFDLKKVSGAWKIAKPESSEIAPVVLEEKFPTAQAAP